MIQKFHPVSCPSCESDLTSEEAVSAHFSAGGHEFDLLSELDFNGYLIDPENLVVFVHCLLGLVKAATLLMLSGRGLGQIKSPRLKKRRS